MAKRRLSSRQQAILDFIKSEILTQGYPPSVRDICEAVGLKSTASVHAHLETLEKLGIIRRDPSKPRAIEIIDDSFPGTSPKTKSVPLLRADADVTDLLSKKNILDYIPFPRRFLQDEEMFFVKVQGTDIKSHGIFEGDMLLTAVQNTAGEGDIVVISEGQNLSVKVLDHSGSMDYRSESGPVPVPAGDSPQILGKVTGIFRMI